MLLGCALRRCEVATLSDGRCSGAFTPETNAAAHWPARQDGSGNLKAGSRAHARVVRFALKEPPSGVYTLHVAAMVGNPRSVS